MKLQELSHDPLECRRQLQQSLAADKLKVGFFLGAGCPTAIRIDDAPLIPAIAGLTSIVTKALESLVEFKQLLAILKEDGEEAPTVESMLTRARALREVAGKSTVRGLTLEQLDCLDREICKAISLIVARDLPDLATPYHALARFLASHRQPAGEVFTTNYDLLLEQALETLGVAHFDGFVGSSRPFFDHRAIEEDLLPARWARVWKLHGSVNWRFNKESKRIFRSLEKHEDNVELLIHPSHRKYDESRRMPYFVMMDRLRQFLRNRMEPVVLFILGYSFSDEHINEVLIEGLRVNHRAVAFALQHGDLAEYCTAEKLARENPNLLLLARDRAVIRRESGAWVARPATDPLALRGCFTFDTSEQAAEGASPTEIDKPTHCALQLGNFSDFGVFLGALSRREPLGGEDPG